MDQTNQNSNTTENQAQPKVPQQESFVKEIVKFTLIALAIVIPVRAYIAQPFVVSGESMDPTFQDGQYLIVDQITYHIEAPKRDDVIVFRYPQDPKTFFIKRIIGLPGETIESNSGTIKIYNQQHPDGFVLEESFIDTEHKTYDSFRTTLGPTEYFVLGDNRPKSSDSRIWGPLDFKFITGRPILRLLPVSKVDVLPGK